MYFYHQYFLKDPYVMLRIIAVQGVCQILNVYWEMIPAATIKDFISKLCREMIFDAASPDVRAAVLKVSADVPKKCKCKCNCT